MRTRITVFSTLVVLAALVPTGFGQGGTTPSQPQDPTAQAPSTPPQSTPPTFPKSKTGEGKSPAEGSSPETSKPSRQLQPFRGTVVRRANSYVLRAGDLEYKLDSQSEVSGYAGQRVEITGTLDKTNNTIRVKTIAKSPTN